ALRMVEHVLDRAAHLLLGFLDVHRHQLLLGLARLVGGLAVEEIGRDRDEPLFGEVVDDWPDRFVEAPPLVEHDYPGTLTLGLREIALCLASVRLELDLWHSIYSSCCSDSLSASAHPTATPTIIPTRASSASRVRTAGSR